MQKKKSSLSEADIKNMLKLEELFHSKFLTQQLLNQLTSLYVKAIDCVNDKIILMKKYFLQKMQFVLSCPQITRLLQGNQLQNLDTENSLELYKIKISSMEYQYTSPKFVLPEKNIKDFPSKINFSALSEEQRTKVLASQIQIRFQQLTEYENNLKYIPSSFVKINEPNRQVDNIVQSQIHIFDQTQNKYKRILRKKSADFKEIELLKEELQIDLKPIRKEDLIRAKAEIQDKFSRFTFSATQKNNKFGILNTTDKPMEENRKGRVKISRIQQQEDDDWGFSKKQKQDDSGNQNYIKQAKIIDNKKQKLSKFDLNTQESLDQLIIDRPNSYPQLQNPKQHNINSQNNTSNSKTKAIQIQIKEVVVHDGQLIEDDYF